jgi:hypothetical protein
MTAIGPAYENRARLEKGKGCRSASERRYELQISAGSPEP